MGDSVVEFSVRAYTKMIMHAAKYPHCSVNGLLLAPITDQIQKIGSSPSHQSSENPPRTIFTDCIPLFHQIQGLTPMLEVALTQIEAMAKGAGLIIAGYYHANELFKDTTVDSFSQRIADKISDHCPNAVLITVDNKHLGASMNSHALIAQQNIDGKWRSKDRNAIRIEEGTLDTLSGLVGKKLHKELVDYDNHLDDVARDFLNVNLNMEIDCA